MYHSRLTFNSNRESARRDAACSPSRFAGAAPDPRQPWLSGRALPTSSSNSAVANERTPFEFELYEHAYVTTRGHSPTPPGPPGLRAA